ncbi:hypothetical protein [Pedobacter cryoconitis]|uniref:Uncharacterized protein n=1 Tax=Pedobacter cryoconitis TaxID=188932 RepID=A0A7X0J219_9SPHI|nr:hypothetical protein [Pedobacter cryoconitis]MBB6499645.1 hypothetical protein [Pedobacter cryoconitis]
MNIDEIEKGLNQFPAEYQQVLQAILNISIKNQAMIEALLGLQIELQGGRDMADKLSLHKNIESKINDRLSVIQIEIASKFNQED